MATISENLQELQNTKKRFKIALENQGQDLTDVPFTQYPEKVAEIKTEPNLATKSVNQNGIYNASDEGVDGYSSVDVNVPTPDLSQTTATEDTVMEGKEFFNASGEKVAGTYKDMLQARVDEIGCYSLFSSYPQTEIKNIQNLDTSNVTTLQNMFYLSKATNINTIVKNLNVSKVTIMGQAFRECPNLTEIDLSSWRPRIEGMGSCFRDCAALVTVNLSGWDTSRLTNASQLFMSCAKLTTVNLSGWDTSNVRYLGQMFYQCSKLTTIIGEIDCSAAKGVSSSSTEGLDKTFSYASALTEIHLKNTQNVQYWNSTFQGCTNLTTLDTLDLSSFVSAANWFSGCKNLTNLTLKNIKRTLTIGSGTSYGHLLTLDSLLNTIKELWTNTTTSTRKLTMGTANTAKLADVYVKLVEITDEMRAEDEYIDNKAPFVQCESTDEGAMLITEYVTTVKNWQLA